MRKTSTNALVACSVALLLASPALAQDVLWQTLFDAAAQTRANGTLAEAQKQYEAALKAADNDDRKVKTERALSTVLDEQGKYAEAMALCQQVLASDQATTGTPDREYGKDFNSFALVCQHAGKYAEAETAFNQALERFAHGGESASTALILINLAQLKQETAQYDAVEPLYKRALAIYNEKSADQLALARCLSLYAAFCRLESRYSEAQAMLERSLAIRKKELGETSPLVAQSLADIGRLYGDQGDYTKAESQLRRALSTCELAGADRTDVADIAMDLADLLHQDERYDEARQMYLRALDIRQKAFGNDSAKVAETLRHLGQNCIEQDAYAKAEVYLIRALQADEKAFGELNPALAVDLQMLGLVFLDQGKYADAEKFYLRAVKVDEDALGKDHPETATALNNLAWLYYNEGHYEQAEPLVRRALAIRQSHYGAQHPFTAQNLSNLGVILGAQKKYEEGEKVLQQAIAAEQASLGPDHPAISLNLKNLAVLYQQSNNLAAAEDTLRKLLSRDEKAQGSQSAAVAADLAALSRILTSEHKADDAADALTRSRAITSKLPGAASSGPGIIAPATPLPAGKAPPAVADKWALVIGISNFKDPDINLKYAAKDATDFRNYLLSDEHFKPDHVKLLTDTGATRENIVGALGDKWLGKVAGCNDLVVIFISSHGSAAKQETGGTNFVVPYEGTMDNLIFTGIPMQWLTVGLSDLVHCNRIVLLLDVCHGGAAAQQNRSAAASDPAAQPDAKELASGDSGIADSGMKGLVRQPMKNGVDAAHLPAGEGQLILASSQANQLSWESKNYQNGVFTHCLIEGLKLRQDKTTLDQAYAYMREKVEEEVLRDRGEIQTPVLVKHWRGDDASLGITPSNPRTGLIDSTPTKKLPK
jgi:tetratricopeptide (TPR) repeat protein